MCWVVMFWVGGDDGRVGVWGIVNLGESGDFLIYVVGEGCEFWG